MLWDWRQSLCPVSAQGTGPDRLKGMRATSLEEFSHAWVPLIQITPSVGTDVVPFSPLIL